MADEQKLERNDRPVIEGQNTSPLWQTAIHCTTSSDQGSAATLDEGQSDLVSSRDTQMGTVNLFGIPIVCLYIEGKERLCLAQISNTLLRDFSYNEIHNRRVALGITCLQCTPVQLEVLRRTGAMPVSSRRCGLITKREAERLVRSFLEEIPPPKLPENFSFNVYHKCGWGCQGVFIPSRYNSSRAKCIKCAFCHAFFSPNKFIFHYHKNQSSTYRHPDAANFNSWRRHLLLTDSKPADALLFAWEDVKSMFNGGCRKKTSSTTTNNKTCSANSSPTKALKVEPTYPEPVTPYNRYSQATSNALKIPERAHPAFQLSQGATPFGSYGEMLRSLSMHYSPWWKPWYLQRSQMLSSENPNLLLSLNMQEGQSHSENFLNAGAFPDTPDIKKTKVGQYASTLLPETKDSSEGKVLATDCFNIASLIGDSASDGSSQSKKPSSRDGSDVDDTVEIDVKNYTLQDDAFYDRNKTINSALGDVTKHNQDDSAQDDLDIEINP